MIIEEMYYKYSCSECKKEVFVKEKIINPVCNYCDLHFSDNERLISLFYCKDNKKEEKNVSGNF